MVTADELKRCLRGAAAFLNRRPDALAQFEISARAFWRSFLAVGLTIPAYVVELGLERRHLGLAPAGIFDDLGVSALVAAGHVLAFVALPAAMAVVAYRTVLASRFVPFVIVWNWLTVFASLALAVPGALMLIGFLTPGVAVLLAVAFGVIVCFVQWHATRVTLCVDRVFAAAVTALGLALTLSIGDLVQVLS